MVSTWSQTLPHNYTIIMGYGTFACLQCTSSKGAYAFMKKLLACIPDRKNSPESLQTVSLYMLLQDVMMRGGRPRRNGVRFLLTRPLLSSLGERERWITKMMQRIDWACDSFALRPPSNVYSSRQRSRSEGNEKWGISGEVSKCYQDCSY